MRLRMGDDEDDEYDEEEEEESMEDMPNTRREFRKAKKFAQEYDDKEQRRALLSKDEEDSLQEEAKGNPITS